MSDTHLWRAVLDQAFSDAFDPTAEISAHVSNLSRVWLLFNFGDFHAVCKMANRDSMTIRSKAITLNADPHIRLLRQMHRTLMTDISPANRKKFLRAQQADLSAYRDGAFAKDATDTAFPRGKKDAMRRAAEFSMAA